MGSRVQGKGVRKGRRGLEAVVEDPKGRVRWGAGRAEGAAYERSIRRRWMAFLDLRILMCNFVLSCRAYAGQNRPKQGRDDELEGRGGLTSSTSPILSFSSLYLVWYLKSSVWSDLSAVAGGEGGRGLLTRLSRNGVRVGL